MHMILGEFFACGREEKSGWAHNCMPPMPDFDNMMPIEL
jgi:hypothetical protein